MRPWGHFMDILCLGFFMVSSLNLCWVTFQAPVDQYRGIQGRLQLLLCTLHCQPLSEVPSQWQLFRAVVVSFVEEPFPSSVLP